MHFINYSFFKSSLLVTCFFQRRVFFVYIYSSVCFSFFFGSLGDTHLASLLLYTTLLTLFHWSLLLFTFHTYARGFVVVT